MTVNNTYFAHLMAAESGITGISTQSDFSSDYDAAKAFEKAEKLCKPRGRMTRAGTNKAGLWYFIAAANGDERGLTALQQIAGFNAQQDMHDLGITFRGGKKLSEVVQKLPPDTIKDFIMHFSRHVLDEINCNVHTNIAYIPAWYFEILRQLADHHNPRRQYWPFNDDLYYELPLSDDLVILIDWIEQGQNPWQKKERALMRARYGLPAEVAYTIAIALLQGFHVPRSRQDGLKWLQYAAIIGHPRARYALTLLKDNLHIEYKHSMQALGNSLMRILMLCCWIECGAAQGISISEEYMHQGSRVRIMDKILCNALSYVLADCRYNQVHNGRCNPAVINLIKGPLLRLALERIKSKKASALLQTLVAEAYLCPNSFLSESLKLAKDNCTWHELDFEDLDMDSFIDYLDQQDAEKNEANESLDVDEEAILNLLQPGLEQQLPRAFEVKAELLLRHDKINFSEAEPLLRQAGAANAEIAFHLGSLYLEHNDQQEAFKWWNAAADAGFGYTLFNRSLQELDQGNLKQAEADAQQALNSNIVMALFLLYQINIRKNPALAHTYLFLGNEYLLPAAVQEMQRLQRNGEFKPLPFVETLIKIMDLSRTDPMAALLIAKMYRVGLFFPRDLFKTEQYLRYAVRNGSTACMGDFPSLDPNFRQEDVPLFCSHMPSLKEAGRELINYYAHVDQGVAPSEEIAHLFHTLFQQLSHPTTDLEYEIFMRSLELDMWSDEAQISVTDVHIKDLACPLYFNNQALHMISDPEETGYKPSLPKLKALQYVQNHSCPGAKFFLLQGLLALRPEANRPDFTQAHHYFQQAATANSYAGKILAAQDLSFALSDASKLQVKSKPKSKLRAQTSDFIATAVKQ